MTRSVRRRVGAAVLAATAGTAAVALALSGCAQTIGKPPATSPAPGSAAVPTAPPGSPFDASAATPAATADAASLAAAAQLLAQVAMPSDAMTVGAQPAGAPTQPAVRPACQPIAQKTGFWIDGTDVATIQDWLRANPGTGLKSTGTENGPGTSASVMQAPTEKIGNAREAEVVFSLVRIANSTIIRADALVVPLGAACLSSG